jgi:glycosyltransferase involved in cell wall biosynthesis
MIKVSIITITYNSQQTIENTIQSVIAQDYPDIEYIIIDGKSKDGTMRIVEKYRDKITKVISEKDAGLYDALNKGIKHATGDVVGMLHSDDLYADEKVISKVAAKFQKDAELQAMYADLVFVSRSDLNKVIRTWKSGEYHEGAFLKGWMPPHPTFFVKRDCYEKFGFFNIKLKLSADYELMLRFIHKNNIKIGYLPETIVKMRMGGVSNVSFFVKLKANLEDKLAWRMNGIKPGTFTIFKKPLSKISQYLKQG